MKPQINWEEFSKIDLRVGTVVKVAPFPKANRPAYQLEIDFGEIGIKKTSAQITKLYSMEELRGSQVLAVVNLPVKQIANFISECLVLGVLAEETGEVSLIRAEHHVPNGALVS